MMMKQLKKMLCMLLTLMMAVMWFTPQVAETVYAEPIKYDLWIGDVQVTSENCNDLEGNGWKYDPSSNTLFLHNFTCGTEAHHNEYHYAFVYSGLENDLTISLSGENKIISNKYFYGYYLSGLFAESNVVILGDGSLEIATGCGSSGTLGIKAGGDLTFSGNCLVKICSGLYEDFTNYSTGIECFGNVIFQEECTVECIGGKSHNSSVGINGDKNILFYGGRVKTVGGDGESSGRGIYCSKNIIINPQYDVLEVEISGKTEAVKGNVENRIPGFGWDANENREIIPSVTSARQLDSKYLKAQFIAHTHNYATVWSSDDTNHWHVCTSTVGICEAPKKDEAKHSYGKTGDARFTCVVCGYVDVLRKSKTEEAERAKAESITISKIPTKVKAKAKKNKITVTWKKIKKTKKTRKILSKIKSIQIQVARDSKFINIVANKKVGKKKAKVIFKLKKKTTYYVRVRYVGKNGYSKWSKRKRVKTKKVKI